MKTIEVFESAYFVSAVGKALASLFGVDAPETAALATLAIEEDQDRREALVATPIGTARVYFDSERQAGSAGLRPVRIELTPWDAVPPISLTGTMFPAHGTAFSDTIWDLVGIELRTPTVRRQPAQISDFARVYLAHRRSGLGL